MFDFQTAIRGLECGAGKVVGKESEYIVAGDWAIHKGNGFVRHRPCRRWCHDYNNGNSSFHRCSASDIDLEAPDPDDPYELQHLGFKREIPEFVDLISRALRRS